MGGLLIWAKGVVWVFLFRCVFKTVFLKKFDLELLSALGGMGVCRNKKKKSQFSSKSVARASSYGHFQFCSEIIRPSMEGVGEERLGAGDADAAATLTATRLLFDLIDADASGALDREELLRSPELAAYIVRGEDGEDPEAAVDRFIATADENGDGVISFIEFAAAAAADPTLNSMDEALSAALARTAEGAGGDGDGSGEGAPVRTRGRFGRKRPDERFE